MSDRATAQLLRYARLLAGPAVPVAEAHFEEDVDFSPMPYEALNRMNLNRFYAPKNRRQRPTAKSGLMRWVNLRPRSFMVVAELWRIVSGFAVTCCAGTGMVVLRRYEKPAAIKFRFLIASRKHAHVGYLVFNGREVERWIAEKREIKGRR